MILIKVHNLCWLHELHILLFTWGFTQGYVRPAYI